MDKAEKAAFKKMAAKFKHVDQWIEDLTDPEFGVIFNADLAIATLEGKLTGDAALYLALRHADIEDTNEIFAWYEKLKVPPGGFHASEVIISKFTNIPLEDACKLLWPAPLLADPEFDMARMKPQFFVGVLKNYLKTGEVDWKQVYLMESLDREATQKKQEALKKRRAARAAKAAAAANDLSA